MTEAPAVRDATIDSILGSARRSTLPYQQAHRGEHFGTAFWFNDLVDTQGDTETVRQYLVTAGAMTRYDLAEVRLRPELSESAMSANGLIMRDFEQEWTPLGDSGVSVMSTAGLHALARRKRWEWATDEITDGIAATAEDVAAVGGEPMPAYTLGHDVGPDRTQRLQAVVVGDVVRGSDDGQVWWNNTVPVGCVGAPVFIGIPRGDQQYKLVCLGVLLPEVDARHPVATFDRIRSAVRELSSSPSTTVSDGQESAPKRWWRRAK
ncbi:hypothetical protein OG230_35080 [Streptomyces sp. NBC_00234]|uniref:hypothetical protein n=1 Tax=Streptomyces sp. NBC_00234 TaxID=2903638 RepID=UPI002E2D1557|nr:hypothetical protein [Streptomyces sp. NBC_00234]